ncbi:MAG: hypothetical protein OXH65_05610 [Paracoccaceae bacterium]|nr:hypothetical protein [Paracoccaceae bacterium]MDE2674569.1 hypothetical protein [Paracoccaceae bacterium]MDE2738798.1 hypothetical protein [Paracoccaceae bacterium]
MAEKNFNLIQLYAEQHAIEVANFVINLSVPIDHADVRRFDEQQSRIKEQFPAISSPEVFEIAIGNHLPPPSLPQPVPVKYLNYFGNDGKPQWSGSFGDNRIIVSCRKYTKWEEVWPQGKQKLEILLECIDSYKQIHSVEYSVTDTFRAKKSNQILIPPKIFKENTFIASHILELMDPRWDFSQGWFDNLEDPDQVLVRLDGRSWIENEWVLASINNLHSHRFSQLDVRDLLSGEGQSKYENIFSVFHDRNKDLLKDLLVDGLLLKMGLKD